MANVVFALVQRGTSTGEEGHSTYRVSFSPNGTGDPPLLMMQTKDLIISCSNLIADSDS